jgi:CheY-like chemotaxis protein
MPAEFQPIKTLIIDPAGYSRGLLRSILLSLGVSDVVNVNTFKMALDMLQLQHRDIIFCGEPVAEAIQFIATLRRDVTTRNIAVPAFLITSGVDEDQFAKGRDAGVNGFILKPVSMSQVEKKLRATLATPKDFVTSKSFIGPDRRVARRDRRVPDDRTGKNDRRQSRAADVQSEAGIFSIAPTLPLLD